MKFLSIATNEENSLEFSPPIRRRRNIYFYGMLMIIILTLSMGHNFVASMSTGESIIESTTNRVGPPEAAGMKIIDCGGNRNLNGEQQSRSYGDRQAADGGNCRPKRGDPKPEAARRNFTYRLLNYPSSLKEFSKKVDRTLAKAFAGWSSVAALNFSPALDGQLEDIRIEFVTGEHGCRKGIAIVAHHLPLGELHGKLKFGAIHFDDRRDWALDSSRGGSQNLLAVAIHYIGHLLGLNHSKNGASVMYHRHIGNEKLDNEDTIALRALYGSIDGSNSDGEQSSYVTVERKSFSPSGRDSMEAGLNIGEKRCSSLEDCKNYVADNNYLVGLWNGTNKMCQGKKTFASPHELMFTGEGEALGHYGVYGDIENSDVSTKQADAHKWINGRWCDRIVKLEQPRVKVTTYQCKQYNINDCCTMIFLQERAKKVPNLVDKRER